jgi:hypothetical protein
LYYYVPESLVFRSWPRVRGHDCLLLAAAAGWLLAQPYNLGSAILSRGKLPRAEDGGVPALDSVPFEMNGHYFVITDCKRYLKRPAEDA